MELHPDLPGQGDPITGFDMPKTLVTKDVFKEGGLGIHALKNGLHGRQEVLQDEQPGRDIAG